MNFLKFFTNTLIFNIIPFYFLLGQGTEATGERGDQNTSYHFEYTPRSKNIGSPRERAQSVNEFLRNNLFEDILKDEVFSKNPESLASAKALLRVHKQKPLTDNYRLSAKEIAAAHRDLAQEAIKNLRFFEEEEPDFKNFILLNQNLVINGIPQGEEEEDQPNNSAEVIRNQNTTNFFQKPEAYQILETIRREMYANEESVLIRNLKQHFQSSPKITVTLPEAESLLDLVENYPKSGKPYRMILNTSTLSLSDILSIQSIFVTISTDECKK